MKNKLLFLALLNINVLLCQPIQLTNYCNLKNARKAGQSVRVVIDYGECKLIVTLKEEKAPEAIGGMELKTFEYFA